MKHGIRITVTTLSAIGIIMLSGCGGGGGGARVATPDMTAQGPASKSTSIIKGKMYIDVSIASRKAGKISDPFLSKTPANKQQELDPPSDGFIPLEDATISAALPNGKYLETKTDKNGEWTATDIPEGTIEFTVSKDGESAEFPITTKKEKTINNKGEVSEDENGDWVVNAESIHDDGSDGYKKETSSDGTSDTINEDGSRNHHNSDGTTEKDINGDGIVDQKFKDKNDDGIPEGPVTNVGGDPAVPDSAPNDGAINNEAPVISDLQLKDSKGKSKNTSMCDESSVLELDATDSDGDATTVTWIVYDKEGNDVTAQYLNADNIVAPTFSPPAGECGKPGAYEIVASVEDANGGSSEKDILISIETEGNKPPSAHIKANKTAGEAPLTVNFECIGKDTDGSIASYCWDFDKSNGIDMSQCDSTTAKVTRTYISPGKYRATCIVTDNLGSIAIAKSVVVVKNGAAIEEVSTFNPDKAETTPGVPVVITVDQEISGDNIEDEYTSTGGTFTDSNSSDGKITWNPPTEGGEFVIEVVRTRDDGEQEKERIKITVDTPDNKAPHAKATATPTTGEDPLTIMLSVVATDEDGTIESITWDLNDRDGFQSEKTGSSVSVKYGSPGKYTATVKACDDKGACAYDKVDIIVSRANRGATVLCYVDNDTVAPGEKVSLYVAASDDNFDSLSYSWGSTAGTMDSPNEPLTLWTVPQTPGVYIASVAVSDGTNSPSSCQSLITVAASGQDDGTEEPADDEPTPPEPPLNLNATGGDSVVELSWEPSTDGTETSYKIYRDSGSGFTEISEVSATETLEFSDTDVTNGTEYTYYVKSVDEEGTESEASNEASATPDAPVDEEPTPPEPPLNLEATGGDSVVELNWELSMEGTESLYKIYRDSGSGFTEIAEEPATGNLEYTDTDVTNGTEYTYYVKSVDEEGTESEPSNEATATPDAPVDEEPTPPEPPLNLNATGGDSVVELNWEPSTDGTETSYKIYRDSGSGFTEIAEVAATGTLEYSDAAVTNGTEYTYCVKSVDEEGTVSSASNEASATPDAPVDEEPTPPEPPLNLNATGGDSVVELNWELSMEGTESLYKIYRDSGSGFTEIAEEPATGNLEYTDTDVTNGTEYTYYIKSVDEEGTVSEASNEATATPDADVDEVIDLPGSPEDPIIDPDTDDIFIPLPDEDEVVVVDPSTGDVIEEIPVGDGPGPICQAPSGGDIYVINENSNTISVIGNVSMTVEQTVNIEAGATGCSAGIGKIFISNKNKNTLDVFNPGTWTKEGEIPVGSDPKVCGVHEGSSQIYVTNKNSNTLSILDGINMSSISEVSVGIGPSGCAVSQTDNSVYVSIETENEIDIVNGTTGQLEGSVPVGEAPVCGCTVVEKSNQIIITNKNSNTITIINGTTKQATGTVNTGESPSGTCVDEEADVIYVTNENSNSISVITGQITAEQADTIPPSAPANCYTGSGNGNVTLSWTASTSGDTAGYNVYRDDNADGVFTLLSGNVSTLEYNDTQVSNDNIYTYKVTAVDDSDNEGSACSEVDAIPIDEVEAIYDIGGEPGDSVYCEGSDSLYVVNKNTNTVKIIDHGSGLSISSISVGEGASSMCARTDCSSIYVSNTNDNSISVIDTALNIVTNTVTTTGAPGSCVVNENTNEIYISIPESDSVDIVDEVSNTLEKTIPVGDNPSVCGSDPSTGYVYVTNQNDNTLSILDGISQSQFTEVTVGNGPQGCAAMPGSTMVYVTNTNDNTVTVINAKDGSVEKTIPLPPGDDGPSCNTGCEFDSSTFQLYISNINSNTVSIVNGLELDVEQSLPVSGGPGSLCVDKTRNQIIISNENNNSVSIVNSPLPDSPQDAYLPDAPADCYATGKNSSVDISWKSVSSFDLNGFNVYRSETSGSGYSLVSSLDSQTMEFEDLTVTNSNEYFYEVKAVDLAGNESLSCPEAEATPDDQVEDVISLPADSEPCCSGETQNYIYISNINENIIEVINRDTYQVVQRIDVSPEAGGGGCCDDITVDPVNNRIFITNKNTNKITVINGTTHVIEDVITVPGNGGPTKTKYNDITNELYIVNENTNEVVIMNPDTYVTRTVFLETGGCPCDLQVDRINNQVFVLNKNTNKVKVIEGNTYTIVKTILLGSPEGASGCILNEKNNTLYITNENTNEIKLINTTDHIIYETITIPGPSTGYSCPGGCVADPVTNTIYIINENENTVTIINGADNSVIDIVPVGNLPVSLCVEPSDDLNPAYIKVINKNSNSVSILMPALPGGQTDTTAPSAPTGLAASSSDGSISLSWIASTSTDVTGYRVYRSFQADDGFVLLVTGTSDTYYTDSNVQGGITYYYRITAVDSSGNESAVGSVISGIASALTTISVGTGPVDIAVDQTRGKVYVVNSDSNNIYVLDSSSYAQLSTVPVGFNPLAIDVADSDGRVFVIASTGNELYIIDPTTYAASSYAAGLMPAGVAIADNVGKVFVSEAIDMMLLTSGLSSVYSLSNFTFSTSISTGLGSSHAAVNETNGKLYIANMLSGSVSIINVNTNAIIGTVTVGSSPIDVDVNETTGYAYIANKSSGTVSVINGTTNIVAATITVGNEPAGIGIDESRNIIYVANSSSGTISVIDGSTHQVAGTIDVGNDPWGVGVHEALNKIYVPILTTDEVIITDGFETTNDNCNAAPDGAVACCGDKVTDGNCITIHVYDPVCGSNGTTYTNGGHACCYADYYYPDGGCN